MTLNQAIKRLTTLGFKMGLVSDVPHWGRMDAEPFDIKPDHVLSPPSRDVFIGHVNSGWYITSHIKFKCRLYRHHHTFDSQRFNIFGGGKTLEEAMLEFEVNFRAKTYNMTKV